MTGGNTSQGTALTGILNVPQWSPPVTSGNTAVVQGPATGDYVPQ